MLRSQYGTHPPHAPLARYARPPLRMLIVEDHPDSARALTRLLERCGHTVFTAATLAEARALCARQSRLDVLLCDLTLPDGDGCELATLAREYGAKAIAVTACSMPEDRARCRAAGFSAQLLKPVAFDELDATIAAVTSGHT